jgi:hypothetical protein
MRTPGASVPARRPSTAATTAGEAIAAHQGAVAGAASQKPARNSRLSSVVAILPAIGHAGVADDEPDHVGEARFGAL